MVRCQLCGVLQSIAGALLGGLGSRRHYRCRCCGGQWSMTTRKRKEGGSDNGHAKLVDRS